MYRFTSRSLHRCLVCVPSKYTKIILASGRVHGYANGLRFIVIRLIVTVAGPVVFRMPSLEGPMRKVTCFASPRGHRGQRTFMRTGEVAVLRGEDPD